MTPDARISVSARLPPATIARLDRLVGAISADRPGEKVQRSDAMRAAVERGIGVLERELGLPPFEEAKPARKPAKK